MNIMDAATATSREFLAISMSPRPMCVRAAGLCLAVDPADLVVRARLALVADRHPGAVLVARVGQHQSCVGGVELGRDVHAGQLIVLAVPADLLEEDQLGPSASFLGDAGVVGPLQLGRTVVDGSRGDVHRHGSRGRREASAERVDTGRLLDGVADVVVAGRRHLGLVRLVGDLLEHLVLVRGLRVGDDDRVGLGGCPIHADLDDVGGRVEDGHGRCGGSGGCGDEHCCHRQHHGRCHTDFLH